MSLIQNPNPYAHNKSNEKMVGVNLKKKLIHSMIFLLPYQKLAIFIIGTQMMFILIDKILLNWLGILMVLDFSGKYGRIWRITLAWSYLPLI